jgi:hypothetical protein
MASTESTSTRLSSRATWQHPAVASSIIYYGERAKMNFDRSRKLKPLDAESLAALARREQKKRTYSASAA